MRRVPCEAVRPSYAPFHKHIGQYLSRRVNRGLRSLSLPMRLGKTEIGTMFLLAMVFLAALLAVLGVVFQDNWAKGGVGAAVIIAILLYWNITKGTKSLTP